MKDQKDSFTEKKNRKSIRTGLKDRLIFGCVALSAMGSRSEVFRLLDAIVAEGVLHFDTARSYGRGFSEKLLGEFFRAHGGAFTVTTKCGATYLKTAGIPTAVALPANRVLTGLKKKVTGGLGLGLRLAMATDHRLQATGKPHLPSAKAPQITRSVIERSVEESMRQLGRNKLDIFLLHEALPEQLAAEAWEYLEKAKRAGVIGRLGLGTNRWVLEERFPKNPKIDVLQYEGSLHEKLSLMERFPEKLHIHHSLFQEAGPGEHGAILRRALELNPIGKVIFSTRSREHLRENMERLG